MHPVSLQKQCDTNYLSQCSTDLSEQFLLHDQQLIRNENFFLFSHSDASKIIHLFNSLSSFNYRYNGRTLIIRYCLTDNHHKYFQYHIQQLSDVEVPDQPAVCSGHKQEAALHSRANPKASFPHVRLLNLCPEGLHSLGDTSQWLMLTDPLLPPVLCFPDRIACISFSSQHKAYQVTILYILYFSMYSAMPQWLNCFIDDD